MFAAPLPARATQDDAAPSASARNVLAMGPLRPCAGSRTSIAELGRQYYTAAAGEFLRSVLEDGAYVSDPVKRTATIAGVALHAPFDPAAATASLAERVGLVRGRPAHAARRGLRRSVGRLAGRRRHGRTGLVLGPR
jgi:hypothetical protein